MHDYSTRGGETKWNTSLNNSIFDFIFYFSSVPLTVLFFEEWNYSSGHYQSISFLQDSWLKEYYSFHLEQDSSRQTGK